MAKNRNVYGEKTRPALVLLYIVVLLALIAALAYMYMNWRARAREYDALVRQASETETAFDIEARKEEAEPEATATPELTATPEPTATAEPTATPAPTATLEPTVEAFDQGYEAEPTEENRADENEFIDFSVSMPETAGEDDGLLRENLIEDGDSLGG